jgi:hypothetical protein
MIVFSVAALNWTVKLELRGALFAAFDISLCCASGSLKAVTERRLLGNKSIMITLIDKIFVRMWHTPKVILLKDTEEPFHKRPEKRLTKRVFFDF